MVESNINEDQNQLKLSADKKETNKEKTSNTRSFNAKEKPFRQPGYEAIGPKPKASGS